MNIRLIHSVIRRPAARVLAIAVAAAFTGYGVTAASAQSGLVEHLSNGGQMSNALPESGRAMQPSTFGPGTKIIPASAVRTAADVQSDQLAPGAISRAVATTDGIAPRGGRGTIAQVSYGCQSCQQPACSGGCNSCGTAAHGGFGYGYGGSSYAGSNVCGIPCQPYYYVNMEALYMERRGISNRSLVRNTPLGDEDFELFGRVTVGALPNCVNGWEFTYVGNPRWDSSVSVSDPNGGINSLITAGPNFDATFLDPFTDSNFQVIAQRSEFLSFEINRTLVGWDVAKILFGFRYTQIEDQFVYAAQKIQGGNSFTADITSRTYNDIFGVQGGIDLLYPIARHVYTDFRGRAGIYANLADAETRLRNQGQIIVRNFSDETEIAGIFEIGGGIRFELGEMLTIRCGGELWYLTDYASGNGQLNQVVDDAFGRRISTRDVWYYGAVLGRRTKILIDAETQLNRQRFPAQRS